MPGDRSDEVVDPGDPSSRGVLRQRLWLHRILFGMVLVVLGLAVLDGLDVVDAIGPDEDSTAVEGEGYRLVVEHPTVTRPALATDFRIRLRREGGFDEPVQVAVSRRYLEMWDANATIPAPSGETSLGPWVIWEFDPPPGDELVITYEARIEPGVQAGRDGAVAVMEDDEPVVTARFHTKVRP
ncbi:MAG: Uncharacterized protein JWN67_1101 [Actinomycetia bacterium]|nr:Uncharacterized protein [Actinomycetes bacterium]